MVDVDEHQLDPKRRLNHRNAAASASESRPPENPTTIRSSAHEPCGTVRGSASAVRTRPAFAGALRQRALVGDAALPDRSPMVLLFVGFTWCRRVESNHRPKAYESLALPLSYVGKSCGKW